MVFITGDRLGIVARSMLINGRIILSLLMLLMFSGFLHLTLGYSPAARLAPMVVCIPGLILSAIQLAYDVHAAKVNNTTDDIPEPQQKQRAILIICWFGFLTICSILFGILVSGMIFMYTFLRFSQDENQKLSISLASVFTLVIYLVFELIVRINLFEGLVFRWLTDSNFN